MKSLPLSEAIVRYEVPWLALDWPVAWDDFFGRCGPLVAEIGFGNGGFLVEQADRHPDANFVGIERALGSLQRLFKRVERSALDNVRAVQGDAAFVVRRLFGPATIDRVYINFPDPWHKKAHHSRRLIQPGFVQVLAERLVAGGTVTIATDQAAYGEWISEVLEGQSALRSCLGPTYVGELPGRNPTKYEQKALAAGVPIRYFVWERAGGGLSPSVRIEKVGDMPNIILEGAFHRDKLLGDLTPRSWQTRHDGVTVLVKLGEVYGELQTGHRLVEALVKEGELTQNFGISVIHRPNGHLLVKLSAVGHPRPTWGVKEAVWRVAQLVMAQFPHMRVVKTTVVSEWEREG